MLCKRRVATTTLMWGLVILLATACSLSGGDETGPSAALTEAAPTPDSSPTPAVTPQATVEPGPPPPMTLTVWVIPDIAPGEEPGPGRLMAEQFAAFDTSHPDVELNVEIKSPTGQGGTLSYLRTGRTVAPDILPDLVLLPADQLGTAVAEQLIYSLDGLLSGEMRSDLFPAARSLGTVDGSLYGYPLTLSNMQHVAYATGNVFSDTLPLVWDEMIATEGAAFAFAGAGAPGAQLALEFYLSAGGPLLNEQGQQTLDAATLTAVLEAFQRGREQATVLVQSGNLTGLSETWALLDGGLANAVQTSADIYLGQQPLPVNITYAPLPGTLGRLSSLVQATVYAISTPDAARQAVAAELLNWLASGENMGEWTRAAGRLPSRRSAFEQWPQQDPYVAFLTAELERAGAFPTTVKNTLMSALGTAVFEVVSLGEPARAAAETASTAVQP